MTDKIRRSRDWKLKYYGNRCPACGEAFRNNDIIDPHHGALHNTEGSRKHFPEYLDSVFNIEPLHRHCHNNNQSYGKADDEMFEQIKAIEMILFCWRELLQSGAAVDWDMLIFALRDIQDEEAK